jgi:hypothetical protein
MSGVASQAALGSQRISYRQRMGDDGPTTRTTLRAAYVRILVWCKACRHQADTDLPAVIETGYGDTPLSRLRFRYAECGSRLTDFVVMSKDSAVVPW